MIGMRTGVIGAFRRVTGVKSDYRKKKLPHNPSRNSDKSIEAANFSIETADLEKKAIYITDRGEFRPQNEIISYKDGEIVSKIEIPYTLLPEQACNFIFARVKEMNAKGCNSELKLCENSNQPLFDELVKRKIIDPSEYYAKDETAEGRILIKSILTRNHFRFAASILVKAMYFSGKSRDEIASIIKFVHEDDLSEVIELSIENPSRSIGFISKDAKEQFGYQFFWLQRNGTFLLKANFLATSNSNGIDMIMKFASNSNTSSTADDFGIVVAKYSDDPIGSLEIFRNNVTIT